MNSFDEMLNVDVLLKIDVIWWSLLVFFLRMEIEVGDGKR